MSHKIPEIDNNIYDQNSDISPREIKDLLALIETLPLELRAGFTQVAQKIAEGFECRRQILKFVEESISQLRLDMKYLMFDLEATKRERDQFQAQLENYKND